jgi:hypothetical protein
VLRLHRNAQRLLKPLLIVNPYADRLTFQDGKLRTRRDHVKYLTLIRAVALLHQYQRPLKQVEHGGRKVAYLEVRPGDIAVANRLAAEVLGRSLDDLAPQTRRLLHVLEGFVGERARGMGIERGDVRFTRRELREQCRWGDTQLRTHLDRLVELEYLLVHRGGRGQGFVYELVYDGQGKDGRPFLVGLLDPERLYDSEVAGPNGDPAGASRAGSGPVAGGPRGGLEGCAEALAAAGGAPA